VKQCVGPGGLLTTGPLTGFDSGLPACVAGNTNLPAFCGASSDGGCPALAGNCIRPQTWLGVAAPAASTLRPNVFTSMQECADARQKAAAHPAVEDPTRSLGTCRQLCGGNLAPCPCGVSESWIVDLDPHATANDDTMAVVAAATSLQGGTCQWCVDTSLCVRWHRARGDDATKTWSACEAPPKEATQFEKLWSALIAWINSIIAAIEHLFQT